MNFHCQKILKSERFNLLKPDWTSACRFSELSGFQTECLALPRFAKSRVSHFHVGQTESNNHSIAWKTRDLNVYRMFVITAGIHYSGQSHLKILKKEDPGCSLRQRACFCLLQQPAEPVRWRRWPRSRDLPRHLTIDTSLVFVQLDAEEKSAVNINWLLYIVNSLNRECLKCFFSMCKITLRGALKRRRKLFFRNNS